MTYHATVSDLLADAARLPYQSKEVSPSKCDISARYLIPDCVVSPIVLLIGDLEYLKVFFQTNFEPLYQKYANGVDDAV